ncbi:dihydrofolate reductase family protein [Conexibacter sp. CPCC 206217]|uniref:dihydrofolate reductase family protein n=1 Tax=Conexibacter sp. CPCC 206217 TaxID=3064574 RepID=UPI002720CB18|nr:dihydrofolate reductase family protein [Conexibacter sp. CPCC 206217]MDO8211183.1 dihydrofolate reductase family protein [Conexibacter sp. CPCC 206217]
MSKVTAHMAMSLDGFIAGPNAGIGNPLGDGGERVHEWIIGLKSWRERQGRDGGSTGPDDDAIAAAMSNWGAIVMGRRMFDEGEEPWGANPSFHAPVFVVTHEPRETLQREGGTSYTFVTDGLEVALEQARAAAGDRNVDVAGGADTIRQFLHARLLDELLIHLVPIVLGGGNRLFDGLDPELVSFEKARVVDTEAVTHIALRPRR